MNALLRAFMNNPGWAQGHGRLDAILVTVSGLTVTEKTQRRDPLVMSESSCFEHLDAPAKAVHE